jgi:hypothetical protein
MSLPGLDERFGSVRDDLRELGVEDGFFLDLVAARLLLERVGESDNMAWWDSLVLSETGRVRLEEVTPKTQTKARLTLAQKVGRRAESNRLPDDAISLFSFGPRVESQLSAAIDELDETELIRFEALEELSVSSLEPGWTAPILSELEYDETEIPAQDTIPAPEPDGTIPLDQSGHTETEIESRRQSLLAAVVQAYGTTTESLQVPYYPLETSLEPTNS